MPATTRRHNPDQQPQPIYRYTRAQAIDDGMLIDLTEWASATKGFHGGFRVPLAVTAGVWADLNAIPASKQSSQDVRGRVHDLLWMASLAARRAGETSTVNFQVIMHLGRTSRQTYKLMIHPGDHGEPVVTILRPNED